MNKVEYFTDLAKSIEKDERRMGGDLISKLSEIRSEYNCFDEDEEPYYRALSKAIRILSRLTDNDTISRQAASGCEYWDSESSICSLYRPSAERRGRWIEEYSANHFQAKCSACGESTLYGITYDLEGNAYYMNYCPNCGARMEGGNE